MLVPWQTSEETILQSSKSQASVMQEIGASIDFEGNVTPVDHFICGDKKFIGHRDTSKSTFLIAPRQGTGPAFFARCALGRVSAEGSGCRISYKFTVRPWDRAALVILVFMMLLFNAIAIFSVIVKPNGEYFTLLAITSSLLAMVWFIPRICQCVFKTSEGEIRDLLVRISGA